MQLMKECTPILCRIYIGQQRQKQGGGVGCFCSVLTMHTNGVTYFKQYLITGKGLDPIMSSKFSAKRSAPVSRWKRCDEGVQYHTE